MKIQSIQFFIPFEPVAWERARACGKRFFTAPKSAAYKASIRNLLDRNRANFLQIYDLPLAIEMKFCVRRPLKGKRQHPAVRPDLDNYSKAILDAMNEICFKDDGQVVKLDLEKIYGISEVTERGAAHNLGTKVIITPLDNFIK